LKPNILFLIIDSLRSDKFFGSQKTSKTPNIDKLLQKSVYFHNNISASDGTIFAWASIFTGLEPLKTGVRSERYNKIDSNVETYFSKLKKEGYSLYTCVPKIAHEFGMVEDFENTDKTYDHFLSLPDGLGNKIISKLNSKLIEPWIYFVHINDIHFPIIPPKNYDRDEFGTSKYERTISSIDEWIGKILEHIDLKKTLVVITSDHGIYVPSVKIKDEWINFEVNGSSQKLTTKLGNKIPFFLGNLKTKMFFILENYRKKIKEKKLKDITLTQYQKRSLFSQRGDLDHFLFDEKIRVPLLFLGYGIESKKTIETQVRCIDIFPTIAEIIGLNKNEKNVDGRSLLPLIEGKQLEELPAFIISSPLMDVKSNDVIGIRTSEYKYFRDKDDPNKRVHLFNLKSDPLEENNIYEKNPKIINKLESLLTQKLSEIKQMNPEYTEEELKNIQNELKKMGYI